RAPPSPSRCSDLPARMTDDAGASWTRRAPASSCGPRGGASASGEHLRDEEREFEGLLMVQPRVHERLVAAGQALLVDLPRAAEHLGDVIAGELHVQTGRHRAQRL